MTFNEKEWKCGKCGLEYTYEELRALPHIQAVESDTNPKEQHGYTSVCKKCGYVFHRDKFRMQDIIEIDVNGKKGRIRVSTVFLGLNHGGMWYETMIFQENGSEVEFELGWYQVRYVTQQEAEANHKTLLERFENKAFQVVPASYRIIFPADRQEAE